MSRRRKHHPAVIIAAGTVVLLGLDAAAWLAWLLLHVVAVLTPGLLVAGAGVLAWRRCHRPAVRVIQARPAAWLPEAEDEDEAPPAHARPASCRARLLEGQTPQARQLQLEADLAAADLAESGFDRWPPEGTDRHGPGCQCPYCYDPEPEQARENGKRRRPA